MPIIDQYFLDDLSKQAKESPRQRSHFLMHESHDDLVQRLCIALEPTTYVRPHRHPQKWESISLLRGRLLVLIFTDDGEIDQRIELEVGKTALVELPPNTWHGLVSLQSDSAVLEYKPGPFTAPQPDDFAAWAPEESDERSQEYLKLWQQEKI